MGKLFNIPDDEEWRDISDWEGVYQVSNKGRVRSLDRVVPKPHGDAFVRGKVLTQSCNQTYMSVALYRNNKEHNKCIHRLVAQTFIPNPKNLPEVDHIDGNPRNNNVSNLRWVSSKENTANRVSSGKACKAKRVYCVDSGETFDSLSAAGKSVKASTQQVIDSIKSKSCCKGKVFVYESDIPEDLDSYCAAAKAKYQTYHPKPKMPNSRKVIAIESGMIFESMTDASNYFNCDIATIKNRIKANKAFNGVTLKFVSD